MESEPVGDRARLLSGSPAEPVGIKTSALRAISKALAQVA